MPKLTYLEIFAKDPAHAAKFYETVCGWKIDQRSTDDFRFSDDDAHIIGRWSKGAGGDGMISYFTVADVEGSVAAAQRLGGQVVRPAYHEGDTLIAKLEDPSGNVFGVWHFFERR